MPRPGLQRKRAAAALSQAGRAGPDQPIRAIQPAGRTRRPPTGCTRQTSDRQTDVRQHHRLIPPGHKKLTAVCLVRDLADRRLLLRRLRDEAVVAARLGTSRQYSQLSQRTVITRPRTW